MLKGDFNLRPINHRNPERIEAHLFLAFLTYCLRTMLLQLVRAVVAGLILRLVLEKLSCAMMLDVSLPKIDGRELVFSCRTEPAVYVQLLLVQLKLTLHDLAPPRIRSAAVGPL